MLVLSRKVGESLTLPDLGIEIHVVSIAEGRVRIGVRAPACVRVVRQELQDRLDNYVVQVVTTGGEPCQG